MTVQYNISPTPPLKLAASEPGTYVATGFVVPVAVALPLFVVLGVAAWLGVSVYEAEAGLVVGLPGTMESSPEAEISFFVDTGVAVGWSSPVGRPYMLRDAGLQAHW